jgi:HAE1 family hydrophobic/amphiphilic exporter-1
MSGVARAARHAVTLFALLAAPFALARSPALLSAEKDPAREFIALAEARIDGATQGTTRLTLHDAIARALANNNAIRVSRLETLISREDLTAAIGFYDLTNSLTLSAADEETPVASTLAGGGTRGVIDDSSAELDYSVWSNLRSGGLLRLDFANSYLDTTSTIAFLSPQYESSLTLTYRQPLARNRSIDEARYLVCSREHATELSDLDFELQVVTIVRAVEDTYFDLALARRNTEDRKEAVLVASHLLEDNREAARLELIAPIELESNVSALEARKGELIEALELRARAEDALRGLLTRDRADLLWLERLEPTEPLDDGSPTPATDAAIAAALAGRAELRRHALRSRQSELDTRFYANQVSPEVNLIGSAGTQGLAGSAVAGVPGSVPPPLVGSYSDALDAVFSLDYPFVRAGVEIVFPWANRTASANLATARLEQEQLDERRRELEKAIVVEVRGALLGVESARLRLEATGAATAAAHRMLEGEQEKYRAGQSTNFLVLQRQVEYFGARTAETEALLALRRNLAELDRAMGITLSENGIELGSSQPDTGK